MAQTAARRMCRNNSNDSTRPRKGTPMTHEPAGQGPLAAGSALRTPRAAAVAGVAFSVLLISSLVLLRVSVPAEPAVPGTWLTDSGKRTAVAIGLNLIPFAGIAFLWFIGVIRDRIGAHEDRFFATVFLGSGLIFVAMYWSGAAQLASVVAGNRLAAAPPLDAAALEYARSSSSSFLFVLAARAAGVFMVAT